ncbi:MAG: SpoIID/LytB domain-containing protein [Defluviitaleaceae bacterium]|nr:SpoIID/LytB domain-containing protein [Defluviitaleaceae bacterium]
MKKLFLTPVFWLIAGSIFLYSCTSAYSSNDIYEQPELSNDIISLNYQLDYFSEIQLDEITVTRQTVARMVANAIAARDVIYGTDNYLQFEDISLDSPFAPYINFVNINEIMQGAYGKFDPYGYVTLVQASYILNRIGANINLVVEENRDFPISLAAWNSLFLRALEEIEHNITIENLVILATENQNKELKGHVVTNIGLFRMDILSEYFLDTELKVLTKEGDILSILEIINREPTLNFVRVERYEEDFLRSNISGVSRIFSYEGEILSEVATITINRGELISVNWHTNFIESPKILRVTDYFIELYEYGKIYVNRYFKPNANRRLIVGSTIANFFIEDDQIIYSLIHSGHTPKYIRVALGTTNFGGLIHDNVQLRSASPIFINGENVGNSIIIDDLGDETRLFITSDSRIEIPSISRQLGTPSYRGHLEIVAEGGGFIIVNELLLEEYLYGVLPSEMPAHFGLEALKIQAVTARSFAHTSILENRHAHLGANLEDSVMSQVYNNVRETELATTAVRETANEVLKYNGRVISANFFSTSAGVTANSGEVWITGASWGATPNYRSSVRHYFGIDAGDLSTEENARAFFNNWQIDSYDSISPWFRWRVTLSNEVISENINRNLLNRFNANPNLVRIKNDDGFFVSEPINYIGNLVNIEVLRRGEGGNIMELLLTGTEASVKLLTEFNIRSTITLQNTSLERFSGSSLNNFSMLPSGFFTIERLTDDYGNILYVNFIGGGFGHGVGMSQYGARGKIERGYNYRDVLTHFYRGVEILTLY